jgi:hypothetical protein
MVLILWLEIVSVSVLYSKGTHLVSKTYWGIWCVSRTGIYPAALTWNPQVLSLGVNSSSYLGWFMSSPIKYKIITLTSINYFGISITLTNRNLTYRQPTSLTNRSRSYKITVFTSRSRIFHFRPAQEYFTWITIDWLFTVPDSPWGSGLE